MKDTGIVRRIDELGRIVIPKEIRKTLRIREGDPLEIYTDRDELLFKKYSPVSSLNTFSNSVADSIGSMLNKQCIVTDTDRVIYTSGKNKDIVGKDISIDLDNIIKNKKSTVSCISEGDTIYTVCADENYEPQNQMIMPITYNGDCYGAIIVNDRNNVKKFDENDLRLLQLGAEILSRQFE